MSITLTRTIHPIGQGAFYTEQIEGETINPKFTVVYDCGCGNTDKCPQSLQDYLRTCCETFREIDILFISHFHNDHINGIKSLIDNGVKIKNIILPYVEPTVLNDITLFKGEYDDPIFDFHIQNPYEILHGITKGNTRFVYVVPENSGVNGPFLPEDPQATNPFGDKRRIVNINDSIQTEDNTCYCHSESVIRYCDWFFFPFVDKNIADNADLKNLLDSLNKLIGEFRREYGSDWLTKGKEKIVEAYKNINHNLNKTSMMVFSSPVSQNAEIGVSLESGRPDCKLITEGNPLWASCLYTGDIPLNSSICSQILNNLSPYKIGTFQIPHHGSKTGLSPTNTAINNKVAGSINFLSCGTKNKYQHPHKEVLKYFLDKAETVICVNENKLTKLTQTIQL